MSVEGTIISETPLL